MARDEEHRIALLKKLQDNKIPTVIYYPMSLHKHITFAFLGYQTGSFPFSEDVAKKIFSLPIHPYLKAEDQERIVKIFR